MTREQLSARDRLVELEAIKRLKAKYFRMLDLQQWEELRDVFTNDVRFHSRLGGELFGRDAVIAFMTELLGGGRSVHHGHSPEIDFIDDVTATGIWAMEDYVELPAADGIRNWFRGYGHYHETYTKASGHWQISEWRLTRLRIDRVETTFPDPAG